MIYVFKCGKSFPQDEIKRGRRNYPICPHCDAALYFKITRCVDCGQELTIKPMANNKLRCNRCAAAKKRDRLREWRRWNKSAPTVGPESVPEPDPYVYETIGEIANPLISAPECLRIVGIPAAKTEDKYPILFKFLKSTGRKPPEKISPWPKGVDIIS